MVEEEEEPQFVVTAASLAQHANVEARLNELEKRQEIKTKELLDDMEARHEKKTKELLDDMEKRLEKKLLDATKANKSNIDKLARVMVDTLPRRFRDENEPLAPKRQRN